ncbi:hypothetical protein ACIQ9R_37465 [Streptomyces sp. NPDC094447]|uniref:hypothetical protein n=1 Tax=Streptomyces sp. NPDC094447 TaxID=3366062 RepID=UPI00380726E9
MPAITLPAEAVVGRRVALTLHRDLGKASPGQFGVITAIEPEQRAALRIRLDGSRSNMHVAPDYEGLHYLDEVGPVPELPMGRFQPSAAPAPGMDYVYDGVLVVEFEDGDMVAITDDRTKAEAAVATYLREQAGIDDEGDIRHALTDLIERDVFFAWEPEDAECAWFMHPADEDGTDVMRVHYLPV